MSITPPTNFGIYPITPGELLGRLEDFVKQTGGLSADAVFLSAADDLWHLKFPPADFFIAIYPEDFPVWQSVVTGAGSSRDLAPGTENLGFDAQIRMVIFNRLNANQEFRDSDLIRSTTLGIMGTAINLVGAVQFWTPLVDGVSTACYLREPMRITAGPRLSPRNYEKTLWALVTTRFEMRFTAKLTTAPVTY